MAEELRRVETPRDLLRRRAHAALHSALNRGVIVKPRVCQDCHVEPEDPFLLRAHHPDHSAPLDVEWLCSTCHGSRHLDAYLSVLFEPAEWTRIVTKAKREGVSLRSLILGWCKEWVEK